MSITLEGEFIDCLQNYRKYLWMTGKGAVTAL